jgi:hypothetical protein
MAVIKLVFVLVFSCVFSACDNSLNGLDKDKIGSNNITINITGVEFAAVEIYKCADSSRVFSGFFDTSELKTNVNDGNKYMYVLLKHGLYSITASADTLSNTIVFDHKNGHQILHFNF